MLVVLSKEQKIGTAAAFAWEPAHATAISATMPPTVNIPDKTLNNLTIFILPYLQDRTRAINPSTFAPAV
jgi:hypothetical protein